MRPALPISLPSLRPGPVTTFLLVTIGVVYIVFQFAPIVGLSLTLQHSGILFTDEASIGLASIWQVASYWSVTLGPIGLIFTLLLVWLLFGVLERWFGSREFGRLFGVLAVGSGLLNFLLNPWVGSVSSPTLGILGYSGLSAVSIGSLIFLALLTPEAKFNFMMIFPMKVKWIALVTAVLTGIFLISISPGDLGFLLSGVILSFAYTLLLHRDRIQLFTGILNWRPASRPKPVIRPGMANFRREPYRESDARGTEIVNKDEWEEARLDEILQKISKYGINSLTMQEKDLLNRISQRKKHTGN